MRWIGSAVPQPRLRPGRQLERVNRMSWIAPAEEVTGAVNRRHDKILPRERDLTKVSESICLNHHPHTSSGDKLFRAYHAHQGYSPEPRPRNERITGYIVTTTVILFHLIPAI